MLDLWRLILKGFQHADTQAVTVSEADEVIEAILNIKLRFVGLLGTSTNFGTPDDFRALRSKMFRVAARLDGIGLLPPPVEPWRLFVQSD